MQRVAKKIADAVWASEAQKKLPVFLITTRLFLNRYNVSKATKFQTLKAKAQLRGLM